MPAPARRPPRGTLLLVAATAAVFLFFFADRVACLFPGAGHPWKSAVSGCDNSYYYFWLRGPLVRGDVDLAKDVAECATMPDGLRAVVLDSPRTPAGLLPNKYGIGWALSSLPWYACGAVTARLLGLPRDGFGTPYQFWLFLGQLAYAAAGLVLAWRIALRFVSRFNAAAGVLLTWLGSFLVYYQASATTMAHNVVFFAFALATWTALRIGEAWDAGKRPGAGLWLLLGAAAGLAAVARYQAVILLVHPALVALRAVRRGEGRGVLMALVPAAACVALQLAAWKAVYGSFFVFAYGGEGFDWGHPHLWDVLFHPYHGLFYWNPALLLGAAGLLGLAWSGRGKDGTATVPRCWLLACAAMWIVNGAWSCWFFGASFGLRAFEGAVLPMMVGFGWLLDRAGPGPRRAVLVTVAAALAVVNVNLVYLARKDVLSSERPVTHAEMARLIRDFWTGKK